MVIGYARVSSAEQKTDWQEDLLLKAGCERIYKEQMTGTKKDRPELNHLLDVIRSGDTVIVCELTRLSRSVKDLFELVETFDKTGVNIKSLREPWLDTTTPQGRLLFSIFAGISQFERDLIHQRTMEGLAAARARGRKGGRPCVNSKKIEQALVLYDSKTCSVAEIVKTTGVSRRTIYKYLNKKHK